MRINITNLVVQALLHEEDAPFRRHMPEPKKLANKMRAARLRKRESITQAMFDEIKPKIYRYYLKNRSNFTFREIVIQDELYDFPDNIYRDYKSLDIHLHYSKLRWLHKLVYDYIKELYDADTGFQLTDEELEGQ